MAAQLLGTVLMTLGTVLVLGRSAQRDGRRCARTRARYNEQTPVFPRRWRAGSVSLSATAAVPAYGFIPGFIDDDFSQSLQNQLLRARR